MLRLQQSSNHLLRTPNEKLSTRLGFLFVHAAALEEGWVANESLYFKIKNITLVLSVPIFTKWNVRTEMLLKYTPSLV